MNNLEKKIEEAAKMYVAKNRQIASEESIESFIDGAKSPEAKEYWQHGMYTEKEVFELLKNSHFEDMNIIEWFELNKKKV